MSNHFLTQGRALADKAIEADNLAADKWQAGDTRATAQQYKIAYDNYGYAANYFLAATKHEKDAKMIPVIRERANEYITRAEFIKSQMKSIDEGAAPRADGNTDSAVAKKTSKKDKDGKDEESEKMREGLQSAIVREKPNVKWEDVAGLEGAKEALKEAVILPMKFPKLFTGKRKPWRGILMYGPPGTGKSFLAKAVATEAESEFFSVSSADLLSKWQGESEKLVRELFQMARENSPAIIFIDEIDSLASARGDSESESARRVKTEFLVQMQGMGSDKDRILVLGATNIPWGLDSAIRRRFERRIYIPLPDVKARQRMFELNLGSTPHDLSPDQMLQLSETVDGYSGSDISVLTRDAIMMPVRTLQSAQYFKKVEVQENGQTKTKMTPCSAGDSDSTKFQSTLMQLDPEQLLEPKVTYFDFEKALANSKQSVSQADLANYEKFTADFGQEGN